MRLGPVAGGFGGSVAFAMMGPRRSPFARAVLTTLAATSMLLSAGPSMFQSPTFTPAGHSPQLASRSVSRGQLIACQAQEAATAVEEPPTDEALAKTRGERKRRRWLPKRQKRGTLCFARRELNEEAWRFRSVVEPLLDQQMSIKEITFVLNRQGSKLRHLLWKPRSGLPVFTEHKVRRILRRNMTPRGRLNRLKRPRYLPPNAPGANYPPQLKEVYADVPPLAPWTPKPIESSLVKGVPAGEEKLEIKNAKGFYVGSEITIGEETRKLKLVVWNGVDWVIIVDSPLENEYAADTQVSAAVKTA